jgi:hypothetical protein
VEREIYIHVGWPLRVRVVVERVSECIMHGYLDNNRTSRQSQCINACSEHSHQGLPKRLSTTTRFHCASHDCCNVMYTHVRARIPPGIYPSRPLLQRSDATRPPGCVIIVIQPYHGHDYDRPLSEARVHHMQDRLYTRRHACRPHVSSQTRDRVSSAATCETRLGMGACTN